MDYRAATADDVDAIRSIARESWETDYPDIVSLDTIDEGFEEWYDSGDLGRELREDDATILLAADDAPVGFAHGVISEGVGNILRIYVRPDHRGEGVGGELLDRMADRMAGKGADSLRAMALEENEAGRAFYRAAGFEPAGGAETSIGSESYEEMTFERPIRTPAEST